MIKIIGSIPVKTRVPLAAWAFAGLLTLLSMLSSLVQVVAGPGSAVLASASEPTMTFATEVRHASVNW